MKIDSVYQSGRTAVSFEVFPPKKSSDIQKIYGALGELAALAPDFISVTYGAGGSGNGNRTAEIAALIQRDYGIPALAHLTCIGARRQEIQAILAEMKGLGIENLLVLRGDLPPEAPVRTDYPYAKELIREIHRRGDFTMGAACYPEGHIDCEDSELDLGYLREKQEAGADFFVAQLCFDPQRFFRFLERAGRAGITLPISAGVMPILGRPQIQRMIFMCGVSLPAQIVKLLHKYENNPQDLQKAGIEYAGEQVEQLIRGGVQGVHIYTMNKPEIARHCMARIQGIRS